MAVAARGMNDGVYDHRVANYAEDDTVGKSVRVGPTRLFARTNLMNKRIVRQAIDRFTRGPKKLATKSSFLLLVPSFDFNQVSIHFRTHNETVAHSPSLRFNRAFTSSQGMAVSGFFS